MEDDETGRHQNLQFEESIFKLQVFLLPTGGRMHAIEIKAGATVNPDYFKGLKTFAAHHPATAASGCVVFGGAQGQSRSDWPVHSWRQLQTKPAC